VEGEAEAEAEAETKNNYPRTQRLEPHDQSIRDALRRISTPRYHAVRLSGSARHVSWRSLVVAGRHQKQKQKQQQQQQQQRASGVHACTESRAASADRCVALRCGGGQGLFIAWAWE